MDKASAYTYALKLLSGRDYSTRTLRNKLAKRFADEQARDIEKIINRLRSEHYLNDQRFAENFVEFHIDRGRPRLKTELERKGIDPDLVVEILERQEWPSLATALEAKMKSLKVVPPLELRDAARIFRAMQRLGYDEEEVRAELEQYL